MSAKARLPLPAIVNPENRICVPVWVPDEDGHRAAFLGTLFSLAKAYNWANDDAHTAKDVAAVWLEIFNDASEAMGDCNDMTFDVRQNEEEPCILEKSENEGVTWVEWANLQLCPPKIRFNRGVAQWFNPGTGLWEDVPGTGDEREDGTYDPPWPEGSVPGGQSAECLSAENILATYSTVITQARAGVIAGQFAVAISATVTGILGIFIPQAIISTIALALAGICLDLGEAGLNDMLDSDTLDLLRCNLYAHAAGDGSFTAEGYNEFYEQLSTDFTSLKLTALQLYFDMLGPVGLSRQGAANDIESADCTECGAWCIYYDFTGGNQHGFTAVSASWAGDGWLPSTSTGGSPPPYSSRSVFIERLFDPDVYVTDIEWIVETPHDTFIWTTNGGGVGSVDSGAASYVLDCLIDITDFRVGIENYPASGVLTSKILGVKVRGSGDTPSDWSPELACEE